VAQQSDIAEPMRTGIEAAVRWFIRMNDPGASG
jgi:hypothetical protein